MNPLARLLDAAREAYLQQREARQAKHLRACRERQPQRPRKARRSPTSPAAAPVIAPLPAPVAVSPAPTFKRRPKVPPKPRRTAADFTLSHPGAIDVLKKAQALAAAGEIISRNQDREFSSPALTAWYVERVLTLNPYAKGA